jgi:hypothetical protein
LDVFAIAGYDIGSKNDDALARYTPLAQVLAQDIVDGVGRREVRRGEAFGNTLVEQFGCAQRFARADLRAMNIRKHEDKRHAEPACRA